MRRSLKARLDRRVARVTWADEVARHQRCAWRVLAATGAAVRWWLVQMGVDPARAVMLRVADEAAAALAALPDSAALRQADGEEPPANALPHGHLALDPATARLVARYQSGELPDPDPAQASLAELFAWCLARNAPADE